MNNLLRGISAACNTIDIIIDKAKKKVTMSDNVVMCNLRHLRQIKDVLSQPSKSDAILSCIGNCLATGNLEDAKYECLYGDSCQSCGFRRFWFNGLKQILFNDNDDLQQDTNIYCDEWITSSLDWHHFTHSITPTVAAHAQDVARRAATARANSGGNVDADDEEYIPVQANAPTRHII